MQNRRQLTKEEIQDTQRLREVWDKKRVELNLSQQDVADAFGIQNQTAISQYLNGRIPLNLEAAIKFAKILDVRVNEISPRHSQWISDACDKALGLRLGDFLEGVDAPLYLTVDSSDVAPLLELGDMVCVNRSPFCQGDGVYVFMMSGKQVFRHLKYSKDKSKLTLSGNNVNDIVLSKEATGMLSIIGRVAFRIHKV